MLALAPVTALIWLTASRPAGRRSGFGIVTGIGLPLLYVAWEQRAGPGTTCWQTGSASGCDQHLNPLPWLVVGLALLVGGIVMQTRRS
jgi:hypothetical protein